MINGRYDRIILLLLLLGVGSAATAQDFRPGFVITIKGDTVKGFVQYSSARKNKLRCVFRPHKRAEKLTYLPGDITGFGTDNDRTFLSVRAPENPAVDVFARVLAMGDLQLLRLDERYIIVNQTQQLLAPTVKVKIAVANGEAYRIERPYAAVLNIALADCGKAADNVEYNEKELTAAIDEYNLCKNPKYKSVHRKPMAQVGLSVFTSYVYSDMFLKYDNASMNASTFLAYGVGIDLSSPRIYDKVFLSLDLSYADAFYQGLIDGPASGYYLREDVFMSFASLRLSAALRYNFLSPASTPYLKLGFGNYMVIDDEVRTLSEKEVSNGVILTSKSTGGYEIKNPKGVYLGLGYQRAMSKKISVFAEGRYESMEGFVGTVIQSFSELTNYSVTFGLKLK